MKPSEYPGIGHTRLAQRDNNNLYLHFALWLADGRIVGAERFRAHSLQGREGISSPFEFNLELRGNTETEQALPLDFEQLVGRPATAAVNLDSAFGPHSPSNGARERFARAIAGEKVPGLSCFNGIISDFAMAEPGVYHATIRPALWRLALTNRYRMHSQRNIRDAIAGVLKEHGVEHSVASLNDAGNPAVSRVQDWLQAGESDLEFITRLMGRAHLYYYFVHSGNRHQLVLANRANYPPVLESGEPLRYCYSNAEALGQEDPTAITQYQYRQSLASSDVCGVFTRQENAWEKDPVAGYRSFTARDEISPGQLPFSFHRIYQYGVSTEEVQRHVRYQADRLQTSATSFSGASHCALFHCGHQFTVSAGNRDKQNPDPVRPALEGKSFVLTQVQHQCSQDGNYQNSFQATEAGGLVTPFSLAETHQGSLLARVVGHDRPGDWRYYEKNSFDPQSSSATDADANPARSGLKGVRVVFSTDAGESQPEWVKLAPHMQTVPEVGAMVWVSRANDDSELPEVQNTVQSNGSRVIMPSGWTAHTNVGSNYSTGYGDSKSVRYGAFSRSDLAQATALVENRYAEGHKRSEFKDSQCCDGEKFKDVSYSRGAGYNYSTAESGRSGLLSQGESIGCNYHHSEGAETWNHSDYDYARSESYNRDTDSYSTISGKSYSESTVGESESHSHIKGKSSSYHLADGLSYSENTLQDSESHHTVRGYNKSYSTVYGESYSESTNKAKVESKNTYKDEVKTTTTHDGKVTSDTTHNADVESTTTITGTQNSTVTITSEISKKAIGAQSDSSAVGASNSNSAVGVQNSNSATGVSNHNSATGYSLNLSATGASHTVHAVGEALDISFTGVSQSINIVGTGFSYRNKSLEVDTLSGVKLQLLGAIKVVL